MQLGKSIEQLARCGLYSRGLHDTVFYICRSLDILYEGHLQQGKIRDGKVDQYLQSEYADIVNLQKSAVSLVRQKFRKARRETNLDPANSDKKLKMLALQRIDGYISNMINQKINEAGDFGSKVNRLLDTYGMPDAVIMAAHYQSNLQRYGQRTWLGDLTYIRNKLAHGGTINIRSHSELEDAAWIMRHLHDIAIRIILHILGYTGKYQPTVLDGHDPQTPDWVKPHLSARRLGYK